MSDEVAILVPVLARPHRVAPLLDSIKATSPSARVLFIPDPGDRPERRAICRAGAEELPIAGGYAAKIAAGVAVTTELLVMLAADDLTFRAGWLKAASSMLTDTVEVVGVNDLIDRRPSRRGHATHFLMTRDYAERPAIDGSPGPLFQGYDHSFCDDELIATATHRGVYAYAPGAHVEHAHHPMAGGPDDETYRRGRQHFHRDKRLFQRRSKLWAQVPA